MSVFRRLPEVRLDWKAYYLRFEEEHGGHPVRYGADEEGRGGTLLFRDGWQYSASDLKGPEWAAPEDPILLARLQRAYWQSRVAEARRTVRELQSRLQSLQQWQHAKSVPLQQTIVQRGEDGYNRITGVQDLDLSMLEQRLAIERQELAECEAYLAAVPTTGGDHEQWA